MSTSLEPVESRLLRSVTLFTDSWDTGFVEQPAYMAAVGDASPVRTLAESFADELADLHAAMEGVYDSAFVETDSGETSDFGVALAEQFASSADTLAKYQESVADEAYLSTASDRVSVAVFCRQCWG